LSIGYSFREIAVHDVTRVGTALVAGRRPSGEWMRALWSLDGVTCRCAVLWMK